MNLPFTVDQFLAVFERYNQTVWPFQILANLIALFAIAFAVKRIPHTEKTISAIMAILWLWIGVVYHLIFFSPINPAARAFGALNIVQGFVFLYYGVIKSRLAFQYRSDGFGMTGSLLILYGLIIYPVLGYFLGHVYPKSPTFGLPCPTTIFTFGMFLWTGAKVPKITLVIPLIWSFIGFSAALTMGIYEDVGLLVAGVVGTTLVIVRDKNMRDGGREVPAGTF
jgi:hypothetical protein